MVSVNRNNVHATLYVAAAGLLVVLTYPALSGPLILDSVKLHALEPLVEEHGILAVLHTPGFGGTFNRIVPMMTFVLDIQVQGEVSAAQFRVTNIGIHIVNGMLVYLLTLTLAHATRFHDSAPLLALATSLFWLLSPVNVNVVLYAVQRMAMLSATFTLAGLALYAAGRMQYDTRRGRIFLGLAAFICLPLACLSKENGILLVPLAFLLEACLLHRARPWATSRQLSFLAVAGVSAAVLAAIFILPAITHYEHRDFSMYERALSQPRALISYVWHILVPLGNDVGVYTDGFQWSRGLLAPVSTLVAILVCVAAITFCVYYRQGVMGLAGFGIGFFFIGHSIESTIVPLEMYFPHRNYLPDYGLYLALSAPLALSLPKRTWAYIAIAAYGACLAVVSHSRANTWSSRENIAMAAVRHNPESARAWSYVSQLATESGQLGLAEQAVSRAIDLSDTLNNRVHQLYVYCRADRDIPPRKYGGLTTFRRTGVSNETSQALLNLLRLYERGECPRLEIPELVRNLDEVAARYTEAGLDPWTVQYYSDSFLYAAGMRDRAHRRLDERFRNGHAESGLYRLELLIEEDDLETASELLGRVERRLSEEERRTYGDVIRDLEERVRKH